MSTEPKQIGLFKKILLIQTKVSGLSKDTRGNNYSYVSGEKVLSFIKPLMNEYGLILKQEVLSIENERQNYATKSNPTKSEILSKVMMRFTWVDCETGERDENLFGANGQNDWDKGVGSALTYGERYFLLKYFHISTDEDDVDNPNRKETEPPEKPKAPEPTPMITEEQKSQIIKFSSMRECFSDEGIKTMLEWIAKPQTFENATRQINRYQAHVTEKLKTA